MTTVDIVTRRPEDGRSLAPGEPVPAELVPDELAPTEPSLDAVVLSEPADLITAEALEEPRLIDERSLPRRAWDALASGGEWLFGMASLVAGLALLSTYPIVQVLSLGYLLESAGRVARTGKLSAGFVGVRKAARVGSLLFGAWLMLWPLRFASSMAAQARLIEPDSPADRGWSTGLIVLTVLTVLVVAHVIGACWRGGKLRHFLWPAPIKLARKLWRGGAYREARDATWDFVTALRLPYYFWLGLRGFAGGLLWLFLPVSLMAASQRAPVLGFVGGLLLLIVLLYLPFLQMRFAAENRFRAMFEVRSVRRLFLRAPVVFFTVLLLTLLFALPLYLLKIEIVPREAAWLPSLVFVVFIWPARLLTGWAYGYATRRQRNRIWLSRYAARLLMIPVVAFYVLMVFFTQYTSWHGAASLYEQHAFLVPVPFLGL